MLDYNYTLLAKLDQHKPQVLQHDAVQLQETLQTQNSDINYFRDLRLAANSAGSLSLIEKMSSKLAVIKAVTLQADEVDSELLQVIITGVLSREGLTLNVPLVTHQNKQFSILVTEVLDTEGLIAADNSVFNITVPIDLCDLDCGDYAVNVNDIERRFELVE